MRETVIAIANWVVRDACENTSNGNWILYADEIMRRFSLSADELGEIKPALEEELALRDEVLEIGFETDASGDEALSVTCALDYCPRYDWQSGDEEVFGCSYQEWLKKDALPVVDKAMG